MKVSSELHVQTDRASAWNTERCRFESRPRQLFFFSWKKRELSSGVVAWICLVSMTDYTCNFIKTKFGYKENIYC